MKNVIILFFALSIVSCNNKTDNDNFNEIISFMIDKKAFPLIPPPALNDTTTVINKKMFDSLLQTKLKVGLYPILNSFSEKEIKSIPEKHLSLFNLQNNSQKKVTLNGLFSKKGHKVIIADTIEMKKSKDFKNFDLLFWFSNFYFSKDSQKVLFTLGVSRSRLAGSSTLYILKKENEKWIVEYSKEQEIW